MAVVIGNLMPSLFANTIEAANLSFVYQYVFVGAIAGLYNDRKSLPVPVYRAARSISSFHQMEEQKVV
jgi:hypothetical protein